MPDFMLLMHDDVTADENPAAWDAYFTRLNRDGAFRGGSSIGPGTTVRREGEAGHLTAHLTGFIRIEADDLEHARQFVVGNPVFEAGGTVEIRALPRD